MKTEPVSPQNYLQPDPLSEPVSESASQPVPSPTTTAATETWAALISNGDMADANFELIHQAREEIFLVEFLMRDDEFGMMKLAMLRKKCREGVKVHIHVDAFHLLVNPALVKHLMMEGVDFTVFNELSFSRINKITARNHCKILVVDRQWLKMGDANTGNEYVHWGDGHQMKSIDVIIQGNLTHEVCQFANELMHSELSKRPEIETAPPEQVNSQRQQIQNMKQIAKTFFELLQIQMDAPDQFTKPQKVLITEEELQMAISQLDMAEAQCLERFQGRDKPASNTWKKRPLSKDALTFHADPVQKNGLDGVHTAIHRFLAKAKEKIVIVTPYLLLTDEMRRHIQTALAKNVKISIYTNSMASTDNCTTQTAYEYRLQEIAALGNIDIFEYQGAETIHAKFILSDNSECMVMTYNLDWRSESLNLETAVEFSSATLTEDLAQWLTEHQDRFALVASQGRVLKSLPEANTSDLLKRLIIQAIEKQL